MNKKTAFALIGFIMFYGCDTAEKWQLFNPGFEVTVLLPSGGLGDRSFVDAVYEGVETAVGVYDFRVTYIIPKTLEEGYRWIREIPAYINISEKESLIIIAGNQFVSSVDSLAGEYGKHKILLLGGLAAEHKGLASVVYRCYAPAYAGGFMSAALLDTCRAVVISGFDAPFLREYQAGFIQGVVDAGGAVSPTVYLGTGFESFEMPDSVYFLTKKLLASNNLIFALASGSNFGIVNAVRSYPGKRYVVGVNSDQSWMGMNVVTGSVVPVFTRDINDFIDSFRSGTFRAGRYPRSIGEGYASFLVNGHVMGTDAVPVSVINEALNKERAYFGD